MNEKTLTFRLPTDDEALGYIDTLLRRSGEPAENQIALRLWLTDVLKESGRIAESTDEALTEWEKRADEEAADNEAA